MSPLQRSHMRVISVSSSEDNGYREVRKKIHPYLKKLGDATEVTVAGQSHNSLGGMVVNGDLIHDVTQSILSPYPPKIEFKTRHNRHLCAYWVELHGISYGKMYAHVKAQMVENEIQIVLQNATGITVHIPPQVTADAIKVTINGKHHFHYHNGHPGVVHFVRKGRVLVEADTPPAFEKKHKGNGLLDVYLDKLCVVTLSKVGEILECAKVFSEPKTNSVNPKLDVHYPIISAHEMRLGCSKIIIDCGEECENKEIRAIRSGAPIQLDNDGYIYKGERIEGKCCIMQIFADPNDPEHNILYIGTNELSLLKANLFTRYPTLPAYASGYHPFWNNDALIF